MLTFWPLLAAFVLTTGGVVVAARAEIRKASAFGIWIVVLLAGLYLIAGGLNIAIRRDNPYDFVRFHKFFVTQLNFVWPYLLMAVGAFGAYLALVSLKKTRSKNNGL